MAGQTGTTSGAPKLVSGYLNGENNVAIGVPLASPSGMIVEQYSGLLGTKYTLSADDAGKFSLTATGTLFGGIYQMVRVSSSATATNSNLTRGRLVFWDPTVAEDLYQVNNDETANGGVPLIAGVLLNTVTAGNYTFIQIAGRASIQMRATVTAAKRNIIWSAAGAGADNATGDGIADATALTGANFNGFFLGVGEAVAANGAVITTNLRPLILRQ